MMKAGMNILILTLAILLSTFVVAETTKLSVTLANQVETRLAGVVPNTVIISVDEKGQTARLSGTVSSKTEMDRVTEMVRGVSGVRVISSDLRVNTGAAGTGTGTTTPDMDHSTHSDMDTTSDQPTDTVATGTEMDQSGTTGTSGSTVAGGNLTTQIDGRFIDVGPETVIVIVDEASNTAYVRGNLSSQADIDRVNHILGGISGVRVAGTNLTTGAHTVIHSGAAVETTGQPKLSGGVSGTASDDDDDSTTTRTATVSDATLRAAVEEALKSEGIMGQSKIAVETENGIVTLTGAALSETQADRIVALALSVPGVVRVEPNLTLRDQKRRYQVKPSTDRDKKGFEVDSPESRVPEAREGDVDVDVDVDNPDAEDDDDDNRQ